MPTLMKTIKKNVYYCDYCKKRGLSASAMTIHEAHCTYNPNRRCRMCLRQPYLHDYIESLKKRFILERDHLDNYVVKWIGKEITLEEIRVFVDNCPACTLAVLSQTKLSYSVFKFNYEYQDDKNKWWSDKNSNDLEREFRTW